MIHSILFTGHMIDAGDRKEPRFPAEKENEVKVQMQQCLLKEKELVKNQIKGIAGGACGGDILFHELCEELHIKSEMYLAFPPDEYKKHSVSFAGKSWEKRFDRLLKIIPVHILDEVNPDENKDIWVRTNLWMLNAALKNGGKNMTLIALWDGKGGDGEGGTEHMVKNTKNEGARVSIIDINKILGLL